MNRRHYLATVAGTTGLAAASQPAAASHRDETPTDITLEYDESWLKTYRPLLRWTHLKEQPTLHAWKATGSPYDYDVGVYWCEYSHQDCGSSYTSHFGDHEPCYVYVRDKTVEHVVYSAWHWLAARTQSPPLYQDTHPSLHIFQCHHAYRLDPEKNGSLLSVNNLDDVFDNWLANGLEDDLHPGAATDPNRMLSRDHWWRDTAGIPITARRVKAALFVSRILNQQSADKVDL